MKYNILLADDQRSIREFCKQELAAAGYRVISVNSGEQAIDLVDRVAVDLVILDEHMPRCRGREAAKEIKLLYPKLPVILHTADSYYEHYKSPWIDAAVTKSEDLTTLLDKMASLLVSTECTANIADELVFPGVSAAGAAHPG